MNKTKQFWIQSEEERQADNTLTLSKKGFTADFRLNYKSVIFFKEENLFSRVTHRQTERRTKAGLQTDRQTISQRERLSGDNLTDRQTD